MCCADRRTGRHQRRERDHGRADERIADRRPRGPGAAGALGRGFAAGARPRADRRADHQDGGDGDVGRVDRGCSRRRGVSRRPHTAPRAHLRRHSRSTRSVPVPRSLRSRATMRRSTRATGATRPTTTRSSGLPSSSARATRPVLVAGGDVYWAHAEDALRAFAEAARVPVFVNGMGRGTIPADHELAFSRAPDPSRSRKPTSCWWRGPRSTSGSGSAASATRRSCICATPRREVAAHATLAASSAGDLLATFTALAAAGASPGGHEDWIERLRADEHARRAAEQPALEADDVRRSSPPGSTASFANASTVTRS